MKQKTANTVLISNRNNVKGLEFPFVICVTRAIRNDLGYRNALYTMLTRSFIKSYLVMPEESNSGMTREMTVGLNTIIETNKMIIDEPSDKEKQQIKTSFKSKLNRKSHFDLMMDIFNKLNIDKKYHNQLFQATQQFDMIDSDEDTLTEFVTGNLKFLKAK